MLTCENVVPKGASDGVVVNLAGTRVHGHDERDRFDRA